MQNIIEFKSEKYFLDKLKEYSDNLELFFEEYEEAVPVVIKHFKSVDEDIKLKLLLLLGSFAKEESKDFFYEIAINSNEIEMIKDTAALNIAHALRNTSNNEDLIKSLLKDLNNPKKSKRKYAIRSLGFEGNYKAALALIELLFDEDTEIQQCAINSLSNIKDPKIVTLLKNQLKNASQEKALTILFNLWRFEEKREEILPIYISYIKGPDSELKFYSLSFLENISSPDEHIKLFSDLVKDKDKRIRKIVVRYLETCHTIQSEPLLLQLLKDEDMEVKQAAINALKRK